MVETAAVPVSIKSVGTDPSKIRDIQGLNILTLTPFYPRTDDDAEGCFVAEPLRFLKERGLSHTVLAAQPAYRAPRQLGASSIDSSQISYPAIPGGIGLPTAGQFLFRKILADVREIHQTRKIHLIHAHAPLPCGHAARLVHRELGIPYVVSVHGLDVMSTQQFGGLAGKWCRRVSRNVYEHASHVICVSDHVRGQLWREAGENIRASVVYNGADPIFFAPKAEYWEPAPVILSIGNLIPIKGHETLLRALAIAADRHPRLACQIIGDGPMRGHLSRLAFDLGIGDRVRFLGRQSRAAVAHALRECTLFVLPSHYEALGCVYLEAMASGKPVIGCRHQGIAEIVHHGVNGFLVEPHDVHVMAAHIGQLLRDAALASASDLLLARPFSKA